MVSLSYFKNRLSLSSRSANEVKFPRRITLRMIMPKTTSTWFSHELCLGVKTKRIRWVGSDRNLRREAWLCRIPDFPFFPQRLFESTRLRSPFDESGGPVDIEIVLYEDPRHVGIGGHGLVDEGHVIGLGASRPDRFGEHISRHNVPVADQGGRAVARVLELLLGDLVHARRLVGSVALEGLQAGHLIRADGPRAIRSVPRGSLLSNC